MPAKKTMVTETDRIALPPQNTANTNTDPVPTDLQEGSSAGTPAIRHENQPAPLERQRQYDASSKKRELGTSISISYGQVTIAFTIREIADPQSLADQEGIFDRQIAQMRHEHDLFAEKQLAQLKAQGLHIGYETKTNAKK